MQGLVLEFVPERRNLMSEDLTRNLPSSDGAKLTQILSTLERLDSRLRGVEQKVEERLYDTRPIWEKCRRMLLNCKRDNRA
jgi:hypothetical protein